jgi:AsmA protein
MTPSQSSGHRYRGLLIFLLVVLLVIGAVMLPPLVNANRLRGRLAGSLSAELGRPVQMDNVTLRLLPRPGFAFDNLEVAGDPAFGEEPVMRAASVTVGVRLLPLWRGRIEVATVTLDQASLNVERNQQGRWNFEDLLQRTSQLPAQLPTAERRTSAGARFPYFEVTNGRVNFKRDAEKLPFSFTDAEFALWLETPTEWRLRFRATPVRTDLDAAYTGELRVEGSVQRAASGVSELHTSQLALQGSWQHAPLGQWTRMMQGEDSGWRGESSLDFTVRGTADDAATTARVRIDGLHREDFVPVTSLAIDANCTAQMNLLQRTASNAKCVLPTGEGVLTATAQSLRVEPGQRPQEAALLVQHIPAGWLLDAIRLVRQGISPDLTASGEVDGSFAFDQDALSTQRLTGAARWIHAALTAPSLGGPLALPVVRVSAGAEPDAAARKGKSHAHKGEAPPASLALTLEPLAVNAGGPSPVLVQGSLGRADYELSLTGPVDLATTVPLLRSLGFARWAVLHTISGQANVALQVKDSWMRSAGSAPATARGTVALHNVSAQTAWLPGNLQVAKGEVTLTPQSILWQGLQWSWAGAKFDGSAKKTADCEDAASCAWHLTAHTPLLNLAQVQAAFQPSGAQRFLDIFRDAGAGGWPPFQINLLADSATLGPVTIAHASAELAASGSTLKIQQCSGVVFGGSTECSGTVAVDRGSADLNIGLAKASVAAIAGTFHEKWGTGTAEASIHLTLAQTSAPSGDFTAMLRGVDMSGAGPSSILSHIDSWQMSGNVTGSKLTVDRSVLTSGSSEIPVTGSIGLDRTLDLTMAPATGTTKHIGGTLQSPVLQ